MQERDQEHAHDDERDQALRAAGEKAIEDVVDVLGGGKAKAHQAAIDDAVENRVELVAKKQEDDQHRQALDRFFHQRRREHGRAYIGQAFAARGGEQDDAKSGVQDEG